ncbi:hypothetical protein [Oceanobacillus sp. CF4.6]|uniref:hypothetical protein n=1 Tax=Oceanobacillus sp. CF4.6 TaxID=3373080 RepID=UPI003EE527F8
MRSNPKLVLMVSLFFVVVIPFLFLLMYVTTSNLTFFYVGLIPVLIFLLIGAIHSMKELKKLNKS